MRTNISKDSLNPQVIHDIFPYSSDFFLSRIFLFLFLLFSSIFFSLCPESLFSSSLFYFFFVLSLPVPLSYSFFSLSWINCVFFFLLLALSLFCLFYLLFPFFLLFFQAKSQFPRVTFLSFESIFSLHFAPLSSIKSTLCCLR